MSFICCPYCQQEGRRKIIRDTYVDGSRLVTYICTNKYGCGKLFYILEDKDGVFIRYA